MELTFETALRICVGISVFGAHMNFAILSAMVGDNPLDFITQWRGNRNKALHSVLHWATIFALGGCVYTANAVRLIVLLIFSAIVTPSYLFRVARGNGPPVANAQNNRR